MLRELQEDLLAEVDDVWSEEIRLLPMAGQSADPDRPRDVLFAVLRTGERETSAMRAGRGGRSSLASGGGHLRIDRTAHPELVVRKHDRIVALDRIGEPVFEVLSVDDRTHLRLICELGDLS
jgi:hypothetical protein